MFRRFLFTIILKNRSSGDTQALTLKSDPGSKTTGLVLGGGISTGTKGRLGRRTGASRRGYPSETGKTAKHPTFAPPAQDTLSRSAILESHPSRRYYIEYPDRSVQWRRNPSE